MRRGQGQSVSRAMHAPCSFRELRPRRDGHIAPVGLSVHMSHAIWPIARLEGRSKHHARPRVPGEPGECTPGDHRAAGKAPMHLPPSLISRRAASVARVTPSSRRRRRVETGASGRPGRRSGRTHNEHPDGPPRLDITDVTSTTARSRSLLVAAHLRLIRAPVSPDRRPRRDRGAGRHVS